MPYLLCYLSTITKSVEERRTHISQERKEQLRFVSNSARMQRSERAPWISVGPTCPYSWVLPSLNGEPIAAKALYLKAWWLQRPPLLGCIPAVKKDAELISPGGKAGVKLYTSIVSSWACCQSLSLHLYYIATTYMVARVF